MKKVFAILLALALVLSMSAMAANISITPATGYDNDTALTYKAYKVFDASISGSNVSYVIKASDPFYTQVAAKTEYFILTLVAGTTDTYIVTPTTAYNVAAAKNFAESLNVSGITETAKVTTVTDGKFVFNGLDEGYYLITSSVGSAMILDTFKTETVTEKNAYPSLDKKPGQATAAKGSIVTYTIDVTIPANATGTIVVHDKMTGLEYQSMTAVNGITANDSPAHADCTVEFTLSADYIAQNIGNTVTITYTAKVTADTAKNEAYLTNNTFTSVPDDDNTVYNSKIVIDKYATGSETTKLSGAKFVLKCTQTGSENKDKYYNLTDGVVSWVTAIADATVVTTDANGAASFTGLADGTYALIETEAPAGYNLLTSEKAVTINHMNGEDITLSQTIMVENSTGSELPSTGGIGTTIFYVVGGLMVAVAIVLLVTKKKASSK